MKGLVRAALPLAMAVSASVAIGIDVATQPTVRPATVATVPEPFCDVDFCAVPDVKGTGEWVIYATGHDHVSMYHQLYPIDGVARSAS